MLYVFCTDLQTVCSTYMYVVLPGLSHSFSVLVALIIVYMYMYMHSLYEGMYSISISML